MKDFPKYKICRNVLKKKKFCAKEKYYSKPYISKKNFQNEI